MHILTTSEHRHSIKKGHSLLKAYRRADPIVLKLLPHEFFGKVIRQRLSRLCLDVPLSPASSGIDPSNNSPWSNYFVPEFEVVAKHYTDLSLGERPAYVEERQKFVRAMHEVLHSAYYTSSPMLTLTYLQHAKAVGEWELRVRREAMLEGDRAQKSRQERYYPRNSLYHAQIDDGYSIEQKLIEMGYTREEFPPAWSPEWSPLINQPRELTPRSKAAWMFSYLSCIFM